MMMTSPPPSSHLDCDVAGLQDEAVAVGPVVHQVDGGQQVGLVQLPLSVEEKFPLLRVNIALDLGPVILELVEGDSRVDIFMKILHVVDLKLGRFNIFIVVNPTYFYTD